MSKTNKRYEIKEHKDEIITNTLQNLIWIPILALVSLVWNLLKLAYNKILDFDDYIILIIIVATATTLSLVSIVIFIITHIKNIGIQNKIKKIDEIALDYKFTNVTAELILDKERKNIRSIISYDMVVLAKKLKLIKRQITWSGSIYKGTSIIEGEEYCRIIDSDRSTSPYPYQIKFFQELNLGDNVSFTTQTLVSDEEKIMMPLYVFFVKHQIENLTLRIIAPEKMIKNVTHAIYADTSKEICVDEPKNIVGEKIDNLVRYTYNIQSPVLQYNYFLEWEFTD